MDSTSRNSNLSFSFNLDLDTVDNEASSDSDATGLQIDVSEVENFNNTNKLRRQVTVDDTSFLNEMEEEIERQLDAKAAKTNLTATNVKNILKHVISNEHVMAMVHKRLTKGDEDVVFEPKLTRAKAKELAMSQSDMPWPITPVKNTTSEVQELIQEEFPEDSSDEEYHPDQDQQSDDEKDVENSVGSDFDSQPSTPATPSDLSTLVDNANITNVHYDEEGIFKIPPSIAHVPTEEESIGHRTRSKLCLSETPLEIIEQSFIPPDITSDMYDWDWEPQDDYINFLKELYTQPLTKEVNIEDDPEADPEYNILEDEETDLLDKEELREDKAVKISKKELKTLIAELDEFADQYAKQHEYEQQQKEQQEQQEQLQQQLQRAQKRKKSPENSFVQPENNSYGNTMVVLLPVLAEEELPQLVNQKQLHLLSVQMSQHIQLMVQQFLMTYKHLELHNRSKICKNNLYSLSTLCDTSNSEFLVRNLKDALKLVSDWETCLNNSTFSEEYFQFLQNESELEKHYFSTKRKYTVQFHPKLIQLMVNSKALMYPHLLPSTSAGFLEIKYLNKYSPSEENLIALGLEQFIPYVKTLPKYFKANNHVLADAVKELIRYLLPVKDVSGLIHHINKRRIAKKNNPIKYYFTTGSAPKLEHYICNDYNVLPPVNQSSQLLPTDWKNFINDLCFNSSIEDFLILKQNNKFKFSNINRNRRVDTNDYQSVIKYNAEYLPISYNYIVHRNHELRNPVVNVFRHFPRLISPKEDVSNSTTKGNNSKVKRSQVKVTEFESDVESAESLKTFETDEEEFRPTRLRMTTPRLAKIKSAQNMKLLTQTLSTKTVPSSINTNETKAYNFEKNDDYTSSFSKGDNEDEIAELMLASTTIKKNSTNRKKTKQARELENMKRLFEAENNIDENERATKFAATFIERMHVKLESKDPELFKTVLKIFSEYSEKLDSTTQSNNEDYFLSETTCLSTNRLTQINEKKNYERDKTAIDLYKEVCDKLYEYPDLCSVFILFLTPHQAALINKSVEYTMMVKMNEFIDLVNMYFAKQHSRVTKVMQALMQMVSVPSVTIENAQNIMGTALKGHPLIMDLFLQTLPTGKPPDSLFAAHMFENLLCPVGPHDKNKLYDADAPELYENIELPVSTPQEDPYGGDGCKCDCHNLVNDIKVKTVNEHCASCGTRFLNGRIYLQTSEGLRPAKITFPGADDEKQENISRVSLKTTERFIPCPPTRKRRKCSKRDSVSEESSLKPCSSKSSPAKDNDDNDRLVTKPKKCTKSPPKSSDHKKLVKVQSVTVKNKREKRIDKKDNKTDSKTDDYQHDFCTNADQTEFEEGIGSNVNEDYVELDLFGNKFGEVSTDSHEEDTMTSPEKMNVSSTSVEKLDASSDSDSSANVEIEIETPATDIPWTMQEDKILLQNVQKEYSEKTFITVSLLLKNRSVDQVKERCQYLLALIEKMA